jgi:hypothetical protein
LLFCVTVRRALDAGAAEHRGPGDVQEQLDLQANFDLTGTFPVSGLYTSISFSSDVLRGELDDSSGLPPVVIGAVSCMPVPKNVYS